jgi:hypothetical protein
MNTSPVRTGTHATEGVATLPTQPENGRVPPCDSHSPVLDVTGEELWPEDCHIEDDVPDVPPLPALQPDTETPSLFGSSIEGGSLNPVIARLTELPTPDASIIEVLYVRATTDVRTPRGSVDTPLLSSRVPSTGPRPELFLMAPPMPRVHV